MLDTAFDIAGHTISRLELLAFALALAGIALTARVSVWGWPPTIAASALYGWLFYEHRLYGDAALQAFFIAVSVWGWRAWLSPPPQSPAQPPPSSEPKQSLGLRPGIRSLPNAALFKLGLAVCISWLVTGALLARFTDTDVPWLDAAPTAGSIFAQVLLARKILQAWVLWIGVNAIAIALFVTKALWLTALLYALLLALSVIGWRHWRRLAT